MMILKIGLTYYTGTILLFLIGKFTCVQTVRVEDSVILKIVTLSYNDLHCQNETIEIVCYTMIPSSLIGWTLPDGRFLRFTGGSSVGSNHTLDKEKYIAILNQIIQDHNPSTDYFFFNSTMRVFGIRNESTISCLAAVGLEEYEKEVIITYSGKPNPPTNLRFANNNDSLIELRWDRPLHTGGVPLSKYEVLHNGINTSLPMPPETVIYTSIDTLIHGMFQVQTINECGQKSEVETVIVPSDPYRLANLSVELYCDDVLTWGRRLNIQWEENLEHVYSVLQTFVLLKSENRTCINGGVEDNKCIIVLNTTEDTNLTVVQRNAVGETTNDAITVNARALEVTTHVSEKTFQLVVVMQKLCRQAKYMLTIELGILNEAGKCEINKIKRNSIEPGSEYKYRLNDSQIQDSSIICYFLTLTNNDEIVESLSYVGGDFTQNTNDEVEREALILATLSIGLTLLLYLMILLSIILLLVIKLKRKRRSYFPRKREEKITANK